MCGKPAVAVLGDTNGDGSVTIVDITLLVTLTAGGDNRYPGNPDLNGDGSVTVIDITTLVAIAQGDRAYLSQKSLPNKKITASKSP